MATTCGVIAAVFMLQTTCFLPILFVHRTSPGKYFPPPEMVAPGAWLVTFLFSPAILIPVVIARHRDIKAHQQAGAVVGCACEKCMWACAASYAPCGHDVRTCECGACITIRVRHNLLRDL